MATHFYVVSGVRNGRITGQWVIEATDSDEACMFAERRQAGIADFDCFHAERDDTFTAEENLTESDS